MKRNKKEEKNKVTEERNITYVPIEIQPIRIWNIYYNDIKVVKTYNKRVSQQV